MWRHVTKLQKLRGDFATHLENGKSYEKVTRSASIPGPSTIKRKAHIRRKPKRLGCSARKTAPLKPHEMRFFGENDPFSQNLRNSVAKIFMTSPIHVLHSNFTKIVRREVSETMHCIGDKMFAKCSVIGAILPPFSRGRKTFAGACHVTL